MGNAAAENRRVRQAITEAVFRLMKEKSYSDISVSDIVKEAQVARASFYRNFESKDAVISDVLQELHNEITSRVSQGFADRLLSRDAFVEHLESTLARILTKKAYVLALYSNGFGGRLQAIADIYIEELAGDMLYNSADKYVLYCVSGAGMNMIIHWLLDGAIESPHELAAACTDYFLQGLRQLPPR